MFTKNEAQVSKKPFFGINIERPALVRHFTWRSRDPVKKAVGMSQTADVKADPPHSLSATSLTLLHVWAQESSSAGAASGTVVIVLRWDHSITRKQLLTLGVRHLYILMGSDWIQTEMIKPLIFNLWKACDSQPRCCSAVDLWADFNDRGRLSSEAFGLPRKIISVGN